MDDLRITDDISIPAAELEWRFVTSGGPGGQHANRSATRAELIFDLGSSRAFSDDVKHRMLDALRDETVDGVLTVGEGSSRSQWRNRQKARARLAEMLRAAMRPKPSRKPTKPSRAAKRRRLRDKRRRSEKKRLRRPPEPE